MYLDLVHHRLDLCTRQQLIELLDAPVRNANRACLTRSMELFKHGPHQGWILGEALVDDVLRTRSESLP